MKLEVRILIYLVASAIIGYLCGVFITLETDITKWSNIGRFTLVMCWLYLNGVIVLKEIDVI